MADQVKDKRCGLYKTTKDIKLGDQTMKAPALVYFHNHPDKGEQILQTPHSNTHNRWGFHEKGFAISDKEFVVGLERLKSEGLYRVNKHFHPNDEQWVPIEALVQLGYNGAGEPIIFFPTAVKGENGIVFPDKGMKIPKSIYDTLEPLDLRGPQQNSVPHLH